MALGDSITSGTGSVARDSYRGDLQERLTGAGLEVDFVGSQHSGLGIDGDHEGHGGATISRIADRADGWLATYQPDVILLHVGTNNITRGDSARTASRRLAELIDQLRLRRPAAYVFVSQIVGSNVPVERLVDRMFNSRVAGMVATKGPMVRLVDQSTIFGTDLYDLHHPNDIGYAKMSVNFYRAMEQVLNVSGTPWPPGVDPYRANSTPRCVPARPAPCALARGTERRLPVR
jgi:lysophospholipase L1-like esterase